MGQPPRGTGATLRSPHNTAPVAPIAWPDAVLVLLPLNFGLAWRDYSNEFPGNPAACLMSNGLHMFIRLGGTDLLRCLLQSPKFQVALFSVGMGRWHSLAMALRLLQAAVPSYDQLEVEQPLHFIKDSITGRMLQDFAQQWLERSDLQNMWRELSAVGSSGWSGENTLVVDVAWGAEDGYFWDRNIYRLKSWTMHNTSMMEEDLHAMEQLRWDLLQHLGYY